MPRTRERAARSERGVDMISYEQGSVFLNELSWNPRPVFQSYAAYTPTLLRRNAAHLISADGPELVLFELETIDQRLPTLDDSLALQALVRGWEVLFEERGYLVFARREIARDAAPVLVVDREVPFGEPVALADRAGACHVLRLEIRPSLRGRLWTMFGRAQPIRVRLTSDDGRSREWRVVPAMISEGAIADPCLDDHDAFAAWFAGQTPPRLRTVTVLPPASAWRWQPTVRVVLERDDTLVPVAAEAWKAARRSR